LNTVEKLVQDSSLAWVRDHQVSLSDQTRSPALSKSTRSVTR
jgi:hypothetical protein